MFHGLFLFSVNFLDGFLLFFVGMAGVESSYADHIF
jgi:hypothetical protein